MRIKEGDKIVLMSYEEALEYVEENPSLSDRVRFADILGIHKNKYNEIASQSPHTIQYADSKEFTLKDFPFVYEYWMIKRKYHGIYLSNDLFEME